MKWFVLNINWKQVNIRHLIIPDMSDKLQEELGIAAKPGCVITSGRFY